MDLKNLNTKANTVIVGGSYILQDRLGGGSFGQLDSALHRGTNNIVAVKLEQRAPNKLSSLPREAKIMSELKDQTGFLSPQGCGKEESFNYLVMGLLGFNLEKLLKICGHQFSLKTVLMLADQILTRIEALHEKGYVHRDIKPENFCIGLDEQDHSLFLIDFGLTRSYKEADGKHILYKEKKGLVGTARYASINAHLGVEQSRRDDLEAIGYTLVYFLKGELPWQNIKTEDKQEKYRLIADMKMRTSTETLCQDIPEEFGIFLNYVKGLGFADVPNYKYLKKLFRTLFIQKNYTIDYVFDWTELIVQSRKRDRKLRARNLDFKRELINKKNQHIGAGEHEKLEDEKKKVEFVELPKPEDNQRRSSVFRNRANLVRSQPNIDNKDDDDDNTAEAEENQGNVINQGKSRNKTYLKHKTPDMAEKKDRGEGVKKQISGKNGLTTSVDSSKVLETGDTEEVEVPSEFTPNDYPSAKMDQTRPLVTKKKEFALDTKRFFVSMYVGGDDSLFQSKVYGIAKNYQTCPTGHHHDETFLERLKKNEDLNIHDKERRLMSTFRIGKEGRWEMLLIYFLEEDLSEGSMCEWEEGNHLTETLQQKKFIL